MKSLNQLTKAEISTLIDACVNFDAGNILGPEYKDGEVASYSAPEFGWEWKSKEEFTNYIKAVTGAGSIAEANKILEKQLIKAPEQPAPTTPGTLGEQQAAELASQETALKEAKEKGERETAKFVEQRQKIAEKLKNRVVYAKVEAPEPEKLTENEQKAYEEYKKAVKADPDKVKVVNELAEEIKTRVTPSLVEQGATPEEIEILSIQTAATLVEKMVEEDLPTYTPVATQAAVLSVVANDTRTVTKVVTDKTAEQVVHTAANNVGVFKIYPDQVARNITSIAFGERFTETIFGIFPNKIKVELSDIPSPSFTHAINFEQLDQVHTELQQNQNQALGLIQKVGTSQAKKTLLKQTGTFLENKTASLPTQSLAGKILRTPEAQSLFFSTFGVGTAVRWEATSLVGGLALKIAPESAPLLSAFGKLTGINLVKPAATAVTKTAAKAAVATVAKTGLKAVFSKLTAAIATIIPIPILNWIIGWLVGEVIVKIGGKILSWLKKFVSENKEVLFALGALGMFFGGGFLRMFSALPLLAGGAAIIGAGRFSAAALGAGIGRFFWVLGRNLAITIGKPILITLLVFPVVVALILFIINSGAYLVPPSSYSSSQGYDNPYISVTKIASPDRADNPPPNREIEYTVTITALKSPLKNIKIISTKCRVTKKNGAHVNCPPENIPPLDPNLTISPTQPYSFTFKVEYDSKYVDALIYDSIEISADAAEEAGITTSGSESVCIGDCPHGCFNVSDNALAWPGNLRSNMETALSELVSGFTRFTDRACGGSTEINLCYNPPRISSGYYAWHVHSAYSDNCDVYFNQKGVNSDRDALFLTTHELTHHIQKIDGGSVSEYRASGAYSEVETQGFCSYQDTAGSITESMAEADGLYAAIPSWGGCVTNYRNQYPRNFMFAKGFME